ncbi:MAG TPA: hypothetical protein VFZ58_00175 [Candidatus Saccharimonadales bacterium]
MNIHYLVKSHNDENVAHIYEHVYIAALRKVLFEHGLFVYLDFAVDGATTSAFIQIEVSIYTPYAQKVFDDLMPFHAQIDDYAIREAAYEVGIEHSVEIEGDVAKIKNAIMNLNRIAWSDKDGLNSANLGLQKKHSLVKYTDEKMSLEQLVCRALLNKTENHSQVAPLFYIVATAVLTNLLLVLNGHYHYYFRRTEAYFDDDTMYVGDVYDGWKPYRPKLTDEVDECRKVLDKLIAEDVAGRIKQYLHSIANGQQPGPNYNEVSQTARAIVDTKNWREFADKKKIDSMLQNIVIELSYGGQVGRLKITK